MLLLVLAALLQTQPAPMKTIDRGGSSDFESSRQAVVKTAAEWAALWHGHAPGRPAPAVDFSTSQVLAVFLGTRPTAGFSVEIIGTHVDNGVLVVQYVETRPAPESVTAQILTAPYHIVSVPARAGEVRFEENREVAPTSWRAPCPWRPLRTCPPGEA